MPNNSQLTIRLPLLCSMRTIDDYQASHATAIQENPANAALTSTRDSKVTPRLLVSFTKYWARGRTLKIEFLKSPPEFITQPIMDAAKQWLPMSI